MKNDSRIITKMFFKLLPVQIILVAIGSLNSIIDGAMASNLIGAEALTATGLFNPMVTLTNMINAVLVGGATILCGQLMGKNQLDRTKSVFTLDMLMVVCVGSIMTVISLVIPNQVSYVLGARGEMVDKVAAYMRGYSFTFIATMLSSQLSAFLQMERREKLTYFGIGGMLILNAGLDYLLVSVLGMGMFGLGLATAISCWAFALTQAVYYLTPKAVIRFSTSSIVRVDAKMILVIGIPGAVSQACQMIRGLYLNHAILRYAGEDGMAAFAAIMTFGSLFYAAVAGVAASSRMLASIYTGEEDRAGLIMIMKTALTKGMALVTAVDLVFVALAVPLTHIFYQDTTTEVYRLTVWGFRLFPLSMPLACFFLIYSNLFQCLKKIKVVNVLSVFDGLVGTVLTAAFMLPLFGGMGIWYTQLLNGVYPILLIILHAFIVNRRVALDTESLMTLPKDFGVPEENRIDLTINGAEDVVHTSEKIIEFCKKHNVNPNRTYCAGLCMEEMAGNVVKHGFSDQKKHSIDVRVVLKGDELRLRLRDDCKPFDPKERAELFTPEDITHNIGLRMVSRIAKSMNYQNMLGLNVLTILV
ncbi:MAG: ATP-binding protein [Lachnospiraceae bacterium]|nr:ATP-binding protein [Lachnospiraceae bacterium]